jgi:hypothetical protein
MIAFIDDHRAVYEVEPICNVVPITPSTYHDHVAKRADLSRLTDGAKRELGLKLPPSYDRKFILDMIDFTQAADRDPVKRDAHSSQQCRRRHHARRALGHVAIITELVRRADPSNARIPPRVALSSCS